MQVELSVMRGKLEVRRLGSVALVAVALVSGAWLIARGVGFMNAVPAEPIVRRAQLPGPRAPAGPPPPDTRAILARNMFDSETGPLWPPPPEPEVYEPEEEPEPEIPEPGPCEAELRVSGAAYVSRDRAVVVFSGPDVKMNGARSVGMQVAGKTVTAIYPNVVVLRDPAGRECWVKMRSERARAVAETERAADAAQAAKRAREESKRNAAARAAAAKKKKKR